MNFDIVLIVLDVDDIKCVINYDFPATIEDYIHRIGRTGRMDKKGLAYSFFTVDNVGLAKDLIKILEEANQEVNPRLLEMLQYSREMKTQSKGFLAQKFVVSTKNSLFCFRP